KLEDMQAAAAANVGTKVLVRTGKPVTAEAENAADWVLNSLADQDAFIEGMTLHFVTDRTPLAREAILQMVKRIAGESMSCYSASG
ncbi:hypothetical protein MJN76_30970, partial [Salmonella enterica subsp. enterica serovar Anatum]|nr:hypothetical protein [Salmonella enterica subsp. enterica serovar Anatum]